jgi:CRP-like cAMP-binding protein
VLATDRERGDLEVGTIGCGGFVGLPVLNGADRTPYRTAVQVTGDPWRLPADAFEMTHETLSLMLGVRRAGVSAAMSTLQAAGVLRYVRGRVEVLDRPGLEEASCGCYHVTRTALARLLG